MSVIRFLCLTLSLIAPTLSMKIRFEAIASGQKSLLDEKGGGQGPSMGR